MNPKQNPTRTEYSVSPPRAAHKLLRLLVFAVLICLASAISLFMGATLNHEISQLRRHMNAAMYEAQSYLDARESLLEHLGRRVTLSAGGPRVPLNMPVQEHQQVVVPLGGAESRWSLSLAAGDLRELEDKRLSLIYVAPGPEQQVWRVFGLSTRIAVISSAVLGGLSSEHDEAEGERIRWLADYSSAQPRIYLFMRLGRDGGAGWLGLEMFSADLNAAFSVPSAGHFLLLDSHQHVVVGNAPSSQLQQIGPIGEEDWFGFGGAETLPGHLILIKHLGSSNWSLVYYFGLPELLVPLWPYLAAALLLLVLGCSILLFLYRRIHRRLIVPAQERLVALVENERFSRTMIQTAPVALCVLRRSDASVVLENCLAQEWLGSGEVRRQWSIGWIERAFKQGEGGGSEEIDTATGRHLFLCFSASRYKGEDVLCCAFSDISERKQAEEVLAEAKRLSDAANQAKTLFLATMSHEIRTPLYGLLGTIELLGRTALDHQQAGYLRAIQRSSSVLLQLISDVLDVSKIEAGQLGLESAEFSPVALTLDAVSSYAAAARSKGVHLYACCDAQIPDGFEGDATRIRQILNNLLSNAVKFTDSGRIVVRLRAEPMEGQQMMVHWQVADTGHGISEAVQRHLFEPFYQVAEHSRMVGGTGLGLSICKRLSDLMQGQLKVVSDVGLGSSFSLCVPLQQVDSVSDGEPFLESSLVWVHAPSRELAESLCGWISRWGARSQVAPLGYLFEDEPGAVLLDVRFNPNDRVPFPAWKGARVVVSDLGGEHPHQDGRDWHVGRFNLTGVCRAIALSQGRSAAEAVAPRETVPSNDGTLGLRILVVEDNPINQMVLREQLETLGCSVDMVADGKQAIAHWQEQAFDMVLTDLNMPHMSGYELAGALRKRGCSIPIIGATANAMPEELERCVAAGMDLFLLKPVDLRTLRHCLVSVSRESHALP
ncbi:response regulator [Pseudomonas otitidis]|uniref:response regulator n=1 Tax=Metapseudomonas otitidis TaxID=319939 RepID=UPI0024AE341D|nr:response regulator [Pseudomonas otitidis]MDI6529048.1 response regulator [Pseudomonas otitidis]